MTARTRAAGDRDRRGELRAGFRRPVSLPKRGLPGADLAESVRDQPASAANVWGFVDLNDGREYAVVGLSNGTAVVEVTDPDNPRQVGTIPGNRFVLARSQDLPEFHGRPTGSARTPMSRPRRRFRAAGDRSRCLPDTVTLATTLSDTGTPAHGLCFEHRLLDQHGAAGCRGVPLCRRQRRRERRLARLQPREPRAAAVHPPRRRAANTCTTRPAC